MAAYGDEQNDRGLSKHRLEALGDGIFAFAMTLLVLDVKIAKIPGVIADPHLLNRTMLELWPKFLTYFTSFVVLGIFWIAQTGYFHFVKRTDRWFLWISLLFFMFVVFVPFSTDVLGDYPRHWLSVTMYGCNIIALQLTLLLQWQYATGRRRLVGGNVEPELVCRVRKRILSGVCTYIVAIILGWLVPTISLILFVLVPIAYIFPSRLDVHWLHSHE